jgi:hypothetical protein
MEQHHFDDHADNHPARKLVAVPDPDAGRAGSSELYRLGVQSNEPGAVFKLGEHGPAGQRLPWIYMRSGDSIRYEIDLDKRTLIIAITDPESGHSGIVVHQIDTEQMDKQEIIAGQPVRIVFAYDKRTVDETTEIDEWCATTAPRYTEELNTRLKQLNPIVHEIEDAEHEAEKNGHYVIADHPPKTARPLTHAARDNDSDLDLPGAGEGADIELDHTLPEGVQIFDPISGKTFVGRRWARPHEQTTLQALVNGGYRLAVVEFKNGDTATLMPNFSGAKMGIQIKTHKGIVSRVLDESANFAPLGPGHRIDVEMSHTFDGDHSVGGKMLVTPPIVVVVGVGPEAERADLPYPHDETLKKYRSDKTPEHNFGPEVGRKLAKAL